MTPATKAAESAEIPFELHAYEHAPGSNSYGAEAAEALGLPTERVFKTLVAKLDEVQLCVAIVPVAGELNLKRLAAAAGAKRAAMAAAAEAERATGYVLGGISPLGQKRRLPTVLDETAMQFPTVFVSAGRRGLEIELAPDALRTLTSAAVAAIAQTRDR